MRSKKGGGEGEEEGEGKRWPRNNRRGGEEARAARSYNLFE